MEYNYSKSFFKMYESLKYVIINFMKILFVTDLYPIKSGETNTPTTLHNFVFEWIKQGHEVDVIKPNFIFNSFLRGKPFYKSGFYNYEEVKVFNVNYFTPFCFDYLKKLPKEFDLANYDVIIAHMPSGIIFANKLAKEFNKPLVCGVHSSDIEVLSNPIYKFYFKRQLKDAYKKAKKIACRSFVLQKKFDEILPELKEKTFVACSGINFDIVEQECRTSRSLLTVLTCANLIKRKNIDKLILAMKDLEGYELKIIGDGKEFKKLESLSRSGIPARQHKIKFLGRLSHEKVLGEMRAADIFILPSIDETFGMVYLEAMASGCITICTKNDGIEGIIKDGENGFLCDPTAENIKETLLKIKNYPNIEKIIKNSLSTVKKYTQEACAKDYLEKLKDLK